MARSTRRLLLPAVLALFVALFSADRLATPVEVRAIFDPTGPAFDPLTPFDTTEFPLSTPYPPKILAQSNSHGLPASAATRNGYCIDANIDGIVPTGPAADMGFRLVATNPLPGVSPATLIVGIPTAGTYVNGAVVGAGVSSLNTDSGGSADDVYCVVATAPAGYQVLTIEWNFEENGAPSQRTLVLDIVNVLLTKIGDGLVNAPAEVCTIGWDATFLTGALSNADNLTNPDPLNEFDIATPPTAPDFFISTGSNSPEIVYQRQVGPEWCVGISSSGQEDDLEVGLNFHAVYNRVDIGARSRNFDDQPFVVDLPADQLVDIADSVELRHVTADGNIPPRQRAEGLVIGFTHYVCLAGTTEFDELAANGITISPIVPPDAAGVSGLTVFEKDGTYDPRLGGVPDGTQCFSYTSNSPGEQRIEVRFTNDLDDDPDEDDRGQALATFDTDNDGNGVTDDGSPAGDLITEWNRIDRTEITNGSTPGEDVITFTRRTINLNFNAADGTFIGGAGFTEWAFGSHRVGGVRQEDQLLTGANFRMRILGGCGYFVVPDESLRPTEITGISVDGRFEINGGDSDPYSANPWGDDDAQPDNLEFSTLNAGGCTSHSVARIEIDIFYPGDDDPAIDVPEWVDFDFNYENAQKIPRVAWAGQFVPITFAVASDESCEGMTVNFIRPKGQPGAFMSEGGASVFGPDRATKDFGEECSATVIYESEAPGEVDIEVWVEGEDDEELFTKIAFPIYFMLFEDIVVDATPDQFVSSFGDVTAQVRGYFVGSNPSGRAAEVKADGRNVPADRWILPDDWERLKGQSDLRTRQGSVTMPAAIITFFMENESVVNGYKSGVKHGGAGFLIPDDPSDFAFNINPHTGIPSVLGTSVRPRIMSQPSTENGEASIDTFGDRNLSYEGCAANAITGNPHCKPEDIAGRTRYYAVAEYPEAQNRGKFPAIASNVSETVWRWAGFKDVTIVNTDSPQIKYVVAHLRDRDGFCDAANFNNTLGVPVTFEIDAGGGVIIEAADRPLTINGTKRFATTTTFDIRNLLGEAINSHIAKPPLFADSPDECQAWIKVTNSLLLPTNVMVKFPAPPSPVPGDIRITDLQCEGSETITVRNFGTNEVNLGGFSLESAGTDVGNAEQLDLIGILQPGESKTFLGGPSAGTFGWLDVQNEVFVGPNDFASLTWEDYPLTTVFCDGERIENSPFVTFPLDGEGEIWIDLVIPFGAEIEVPLVAGWNLVPTGQGTVALDTAFGGFQDKVTAVYVWDPVLEEWTHWIAGAPAGVNTITEIGSGMFMWVLVKEPFTVTLPK